MTYRSLTHARLIDLLTAEASLLGPCTPLPALYEEVLRMWRGLPVHTARMQAAEGLLTQIRAESDGLPTLLDIMQDEDAPRDARLLAATLLAHARPAPRPSWPEANTAPLAALLSAMIHFPYPDGEGRYARCLAALPPVDPLALASLSVLDALPDPCLLLAFLKGLLDDTLDAATFATGVLHAHLLHPGVAPQRPLRRLHRLLDYLGLSQMPEVLTQYRQLVSLVWPQATEATWPHWRWITLPGGPDLFPQALDAVAAGEVTLMRLYVLKHAPLPPVETLRPLLATLDGPLALLLAWLRPEARKAINDAVTISALSWMLGSQEAAAAAAYAQPEWWDAWRHDGLTAARQALAWLQEMPLPPADDDGPAYRHAWIDAHLLPGYRNICANLLLARAADGEGGEPLLAMARDGEVPAIRALAVLPSPSPLVYDTLRRQQTAGTHPAQKAATAALDHLARTQGLPNAAELARQRLLAAAWDDSLFSGERVRVGWETGGYRLRLSLQAGEVNLEALGPIGTLARIPSSLRQTAEYRQAREAQKHAQEQYRLFKQRLEGHMLDAVPFATREIAYLMRHPIFGHLAERLLWQTAQGDVVLWAGPDCWEMVTGERRDLDDGLTASLVHPITLAAAGMLVPWQMLAADRRLIQPFKQLFREVYSPEDGDALRTERFAGRCLQPSKAYALLRTAGFAPGSGIARRRWPHGITAHLCWAEGAASRDLFGPHQKREVTSGAIWFTQSESPLPLGQVDPIVFSETLRAADLLTTRAAAGQADLTSRETLALRAAILREMARSFDLTNVLTPEDGQYAVVIGARAMYRVNLLSGTVLLEPEGRQILVPHVPTRWEPTEDTDATTAIISVILALAHDDEITDLTFLAQL